MKYRKLGASDLEVSEISLGSWLTYGVGVAGENAVACVDRAFELGINFIDTANVYGRGAAETFLGEVLARRPRDSYILATKLYFPMSATDSGQSRAQIAKQIDASLQRLRIDHVDLYQPARLDPTAKSYLQQYEPLPNRSDPTNNYLDSTPNQNTDDNVSARIDHQFRNQSQLFGRYTVNDERDRVNSSFPLRPTDENLRGQQAAIGYTRGGGAWLNEAFDEALLAHPEQFVNTIAEKLLMYAISRNVQYYDAPWVRAIVRDSAKNKYTFESLVLGVVKSPPFQMRKAAETEAKPPVQTAAAH